jgi:hypothetical protein
MLAFVREGDTVFVYSMDRLCNYFFTNPRFHTCVNF